MTKAIAQELYISPKTVRRHLANIRKRFGARSSLTLIRLFCATGDAMTCTGLTPREREVLALSRQGLTCREIAQRLNIGLSAVKRHREHMLAKNNCGSMRELISAVMKPRSL